MLDCETWWFDHQAIDMGVLQIGGVFISVALVIVRWCSQVPEVSCSILHLRIAILQSQPVSKQCPCSIHKCSLKTHFYHQDCASWLKQVCLAMFYLQMFPENPLLRDAILRQSHDALFHAQSLLNHQRLRALCKKKQTKWDKPCFPCQCHYHRKLFTIAFPNLSKN